MIDRRRVALALLVAALAGPLAAASGQTAAPTPRPLQITAVRVGIGDRYKAGVWTAVNVTVHNGDQPLSGRMTLDVIVPDDEGMAARYTAVNVPQRLERGAETTVRLFVRFGRTGGSPLTAELRVDGQVAVARAFPIADKADEGHYLAPLDPNQLWIVVIGPSSLGVAEALEEPGSKRKPVVVQIDDFEQLPHGRLGYDGVDAVIVATSKPSIYQGLKPLDPRLTAIDGWSVLGGRLLLAVGPQGAGLFQRGAPLERFLPGRLGAPLPLRLTGGLETYSGSTIPLPMDEMGDEPLRIPQLTGIHDALVEVTEADVPLVVRGAREFGQVVFLAADLDRPPLSTWQAREALLRRLLAIDVGRREERASGGAVVHYGYVDLAGQLRKALNHFPGVSMVSFGTVVGLVTLYLLLILPADYFFLRRVLGRMIFTWVTFPLVVVAAIVGVYFLAHGTKGEEIRLCQADLVDIDTVAGRVRGTTWATVFSPQTRFYDVTARPAATDGSAEVLVGWFGLSGTGLGAMGANAGGLLSWPEPYDFAPQLDRLRGLPIPVWSTRSLMVQWTAAARSSVEADLADDDHFLAGSITNAFGFPLQRCLLAYGPWAHDLGTIEPGQVLPLGPSVKRSELKAFLNGRKIVYEEGENRNYRQVSTPYDQSSLDVPYILQTMMFFTAAGGQQYTRGLAGGHLGWLDQSSLLDAGRAILVGLGPAADGVSAEQPQSPGCEILLDGQPVAPTSQQRTTVYRFIFPVKQPVASSAANAPGKR